MRALLAAGLLLTASTSFAEGETAAASNVDAKPEPAVRKRYNPGLGVRLFGDARGYEALNGAASSVGAGLSYAFDLVTLSAEYLQTVPTVVDKRPSFVRGALDFTLFTAGTFAATGRIGAQLGLNLPAAQTTTESRTGYGLELGVGARYRFATSFDVFAMGTVQTMRALSGPLQTWANPGGLLGIAYYPLASAE